MNNQNKQGEGPVSTPENHSNHLTDAQAGDSGLMRFALSIEYNGSAYHGWQSQRGAMAVQDALDKAISSVANITIKSFCAGRTDAGVHGLSQVVHFDSPIDRGEKAWVQGVNANLPKDISVRWAKKVPDDFHARFSALARQYRYVIYDSSVRPALLSQRVTWCRKPLNVSHMHEAAQCLLGERDFSSFRAAGCQSKTAMRNIHFITVRREGSMVMIEIKANAFLYHMVRNIAGALIEVGKGYKQVEWISEILEEKDRSKASVTAPAQGLYFVGVEYPAHFALPKPVMCNHFVNY